MKEGWEVKKLGEVCDVLNGFAFKSDKYVDNGVRVIRITNVQHGYIEDNDPKFYPVDECYRLGQYMLKEHDLLMSLTGNVGRVGLLDGKYLPAALNQRVACLRIKDNSVELKYIFHHLNSELFETRCIQSAKGIAQKNMSTEWLKEYSIPIPPLEEQSRIVEELDQLSNIIEKKRQQLNELDNLAQSIFYDMFGDPVTNEKGWEVKKLKDIAVSQIGLTYKPENVSTEGTVVLRSSNIQDSCLDFSDIVRVNCNIKDKQYVQEGDILMCSRNGSFRLVGKVAMIKNLQERMSYGAFMTIIRSQYQDFLFAFFKSPAFRVQLTTSKTATINQITVKMLDEIRIPLPPFELQQLFAQKIEAIEKEKELIKQSIKETEELFNSRMDYYFG